MCLYFFTFQISYSQVHSPFIKNVWQRREKKKKKLPTERWPLGSDQIRSVTESCPTLCDCMDCSARPPCPLPSPGVCPSPCPLNQHCHPTISSSVTSFSSCLQSFPASGSLPMSHLFALGGQGTGVSALASVFPMNIQD